MDRPSASTLLLRSLGNPPTEPDAAVDGAVTDALATARAAWPTVAITDEQFVPYLAERMADDLEPVTAVQRLAVTDLYLACAISLGNPAALREFNNHYLRDLARVLAHLDGGTALLEDVRQAVRERVLEPRLDGKPKITEFSGRGRLRGWLEVVTVREALQLLRARRREVPLPPDAAAVDALSGAIDREQGNDRLAPRERAVVRDALATALAALTTRERNLLRQSYLHELSIDQLAALYRVHRATAARWIAHVRNAVLKQTRREVAAALRLEGDDLDSIMGRVAGNLDLSLRATLSHEHAPATH